MSNINLILENKEIINQYLIAYERKEIFRCKECGLISNDRKLFSADRPRCKKCRTKQLSINKNK